MCAIMWAKKSYNKTLIQLILKIHGCIINTKSQGQERASGFLCSMTSAVKRARNSRFLGGHRAVNI